MEIKSRILLKLSQIERYLKDKYQIKLSKGKIKIIIAVYFNEYMGIRLIFFYLA